ncbi:hypothetical protein H4F17_01360 [Vibrio cholerae]
MVINRLDPSGLWAKWEVGCGLWVVGCGLWVVGCGLWIVEKNTPAGSLA